ncbi:unnamed protein product [Caenorhabditis auriculariae]|uniref:Protein-lysine N-methyltransferase CAUJ_LOCUS13986 n=1 Tax=Caenorhabditis auriculariae TaxID=2777116 RepID=A0A8S1HRU0_9PELO|nr:unnamed protein product [Caenorhabditis auriculariae]
MSGNDVEIAASKLGTKEFWDERYEVELKNFEEFGDEGEIWFGQSAEKRIVDHLGKSKTPKNSKIVDIGCGNGSVLRRLKEKGFTDLIGVDYCEAAVRLAEQSSREDDGFPPEIEIRFEQLDILAPQRPFFDGSFSIVLDKGTWDAISLAEDREERLKKYKKSVVDALSPDGQFIIFSCNFTEEELKGQFSDTLVFDAVIPATHSFSFGGKDGVTSTGIVFRKRNC